MDGKIRQMAPDQKLLKQVRSSIEKILVGKSVMATEEPK